jgi:hypothetical protein
MNVSNHLPSLCIHITHTKNIVCSFLKYGSDLLKEFVHTYKSDHIKNDNKMPVKSQKACKTN